MKRFFLIGRDIGASLSPQIHREIYDFLGVDAQYDLCPLADIGEFKPVLYRQPTAGFNVTTPYKTAIIDQIDRDFSDCNSVNTLKIMPNGEIHGYSTDGKGFILDAERLSLDLSRVLIIGHGGAAKSIIHELNSKKSEIFVISRGSSHAIDQTIREKNVSLVINCSGLDMPISHTNTSSYDLRYTLNVDCAQNGIGMLIYQAILADEIFFDCKIDLSIFSRIYQKLTRG